MIKSVEKKGGFFLFLRAQLSAQMATLADFVLTILLVKLFNIYYVYATLSGAIFGGIVNCIINYKWTFKATDCKKTHIAIKYSIVWLCSIGLNTYGTYLFTELLGKIPWVKHTLSIHFGDYFIIPKLIVSIFVALLWNYNLQRLFVYRNIHIKSHLKRKQK